MIANRKKIYFTLFFTFVLVLTGRAATFGEEPMVSLSLADGLAGETVRCVMTDHSGGTWIATSSGINVYDGRQLSTFPLTNEKGHALEVYSLAEVKGWSVYAATEDGLYRIQQNSDHAERVLPEVERPLSLLAVGDTLYIGSEQGLLMYDGKQLYHHDVDVSRKGLSNIVRQYAKGDDGLIWFLDRYDLNSFDPKTKKIQRYPLSLPSQETPLTQFAILDDMRFMVGTRGHGLFLCDVKAGTAQRVPDVGNVVMTVQRSSDGTICVATDGTGAYRLEVSGKRLEVREHFHPEADVRHRLPTNGVYCYYRDRNGVNWFGFVRYGLAHSYHHGDLFQPLQLGDFTLDGVNVRTFCRHGDDVVIGLQNGCYYVNTKTHQYRYFSPDELAGGHIVNTICWYDGNFYIGTFDSGISVLNPQTLQMQRQHISPLLDNATVGDLKAGPDGRLWIGCTHGLFIVRNQQVEQHFTEQNSRIVGGLILSITFDKSGNAWLTGAQGCALYSARSREIVETNFPKDFFNRQPWMRGARGHDGLVFLRTGPKTFYTNEDMTSYGELQLPVTLKDKWCRSMIDDQQGRYLLASERGIFCFEYEKGSIALKKGGTVLHFGDAEGLYGDFINHMSLDSLGRLWVATSQGLFKTDLQRLARWQTSKQYQVLLINIRKGSDLLTKQEEYVVNNNHELRLCWNFTSQVVQMELMLPDYARHHGRIYEYRLGGDAWQLVDDGQLIRLSQLVLGKHRLEVRLAGVPGTASVYTITVVPSFWAIFEFVLLVLALVALWLWWRYRKYTKEVISEHQQTETALLEEMQELQQTQNDISLTSFSDQGQSVALRILSPLTSEKYQKVKIDDEECEDIVRRMKEYLERERVYTNAELKMKDLADVLHLSAPKLSQVFNLYMGQNYYDFINGYRLDEFKRLIAAGEYKRYTITALSEQCGFKKSNFFSTFRKVEGITPAEYLKKHGIKV